MNEHILFQSLDKLPSIGRNTQAKLKNLLSRLLDRNNIRIIDILYNVPRYYIDRSQISALKNADINKSSTFIVKIISFFSPRLHSKAPIEILCADDSGKLYIQFFIKNKQWLRSQFNIGDEIIVSGKTSLYKNKLMMTHPDYMLPLARRHLLPAIEPIYSLANGITNKAYQKYVEYTLNLIPDFPEWIDENIVEKWHLPTYKEGITAIHKPRNLNLETYKTRLAYDELLAHQLGLRFLKNPVPNKLKNLNYDAIEKLKNLLPFTLSEEQENSVSQIISYLQKPQTMSCLLQGEVGAGKTIVAALAMALIASNGYQCALMAPTEVLAKQHFTNLEPLFSQLGLKTYMLSRVEKNKKTIDAIKNGDAAITIGTHALLYEQITFKNLALTVIDEQHRFGVEQRATLLHKAQIPHLLIMTATPIPRTLVLTEFGETDIIQIKNKPKGRQPIKTTILSNTKIPELLARLQKIISEGEKIYWVCPLIEESEALELMDSTNRYDSLYQIFKNKVGLMHGKQHAKEKEQVLQNFIDGTIQILVATTVIEVGVDVTDANIMIIEHAERFGLSQLHQLRGRVGRGKDAAKCVLLYQEPLSPIAKQRLSIIQNSEDGFHIAEQDLLLRGEGEILGTKQAGNLNFIFADLAKHANLLEHARSQAKTHVIKDRNLLNIYSTVTDLAKLRG